MTKPRSVAATANDNSIPGSRIEDGTITQDKFDGTVSFPPGLGSVTDDTVDDDAAISASKLSYQAAASSHSRSIADRFTDLRSALDFIPATEHDAIRAGTSAYDCTSDLQTFINSGGGYIPPGVYNISSSLRMATNLSTLRGFKAYWSGGSNQTVLNWTGAAGGTAIRASGADFPSIPTYAISACTISDLKIQGNNIAGIGILCNYMINDSSVERVTITGCTNYGLLALNIYYAVFRDLSVRSNPGIGLCFGYHPDYSGNTPINGVLIENCRAHSCGQRYDTVSAPTGFDINNNPAGGCGILLSVGASVTLLNTNAERSYGPGITIKGGQTVTEVSGVYTELNSVQAVTDGVSPKRIGILLLNDTPTSNTTTLSNIYLLDSSQSSNNDVVYLLNQAPARGRFIFYSPRRLIFESNDGDFAAITVRDPATCSFGNSINNRIYANDLSVNIFGASSNTLGGSTPGGSSAVQIIPLQNEENWASGTTLDLFKIQQSLTGAARAGGATILASVAWMNYEAGTANTVTRSYIINVAAAMVSSSLSSGNITHTITEIGASANEKVGSNAVLGGTSISGSVSITSSDSYEIVFSTTPTSNGSQAFNRVSASAVLLGSGLGLAKIPSISGA